MKKLQALGGFNTEKTCSNTWGVIKKKLFTDASGSSTLPTSKWHSVPYFSIVASSLTIRREEGSSQAPTKTPKKGIATPVKRANPIDDEDDVDGASPVKKRKTSVKKIKVAEEDEASN